MNIDLQKSAGENHARLTIDIDGLGRTIVFKSGGIAENPETYTATAGGGYTAEGLYDAWQIEGEITVSKDMAIWLMRAYKARKSANNISAVYEIYSTTGKIILKHQFDNVVVSKMPNLNLDALGGEVSMQVSFSLNEHISGDFVDA